MGVIWKCIQCRVDRSAPLFVEDVAGIFDTDPVLRQRQTSAEQLAAITESSIRYPCCRKSPHTLKAVDPIGIELFRLLGRRQHHFGFKGMDEPRTHTRSFDLVYNLGPVANRLDRHR